MQTPAGLPDQGSGQAEASSSADLPLDYSQQDVDSVASQPGVAQGHHKDMAAAEPSDGAAGYLQHSLDAHNRPLNSTVGNAEGMQAVDSDGHLPTDINSQPEYAQQQSTAGVGAEAGTMQQSQFQQANLVGIMADKAAAEGSLIGADCAADLLSAEQSSQLAEGDNMQSHDEVAHAARHGSPDRGVMSQPQSRADTPTTSLQMAEPTDTETLGGSAVAWQQSEAATMQQEVQLQPRFYAAIDLLMHSGMHKRRSAQFLQNCRLAGLGFDMMARQGLVLNFMDSMSSCCLGVQCAGPSPQAALQGLFKVLSATSCLSTCTQCMPIAEICD
ncbi:hypothetical protein MMC08_000958 [Hypocenomyce scalaris]|nr:hypothetical protein [Hypocenomyce scalaris]